jgi:hypothetical protein
MILPNSNFGVVSNIKEEFPWFSDISYAVNRKKSIFSKKQIREFKKLTKKFNLKEIGN